MLFGAYKRYFADVKSFNNLFLWNAVFALPTPVKYLSLLFTLRVADNRTVALCQTDWHDLKGKAHMTRRDIRYQAAITHDHHVLLLRIVLHDGTTFWVPPGGGREGEETAECCVCREVFEETSLTVEVERLLFAAPDMSGGMYDFIHTYLCQVRSGTVQPGIHPACDSTIREAEWFDLRDPASWPPLLVADPITYPWLEKLRAELGHP